MTWGFNSREPLRKPVPSWLKSRGLAYISAMPPFAHSIHWNALERLRARFLAGTAGENDYWQSLEELESYDQTFAQRIGWKWDAVLQELVQQGWNPPPGPLLDWGCGTGIGHRSFFHVFPESLTGGLRVWDRSNRAMDFASDRFQQRYPGHAIKKGTNEPASVVLLSHVLTELDSSGVESFLSQARQATAVVCVEPGTSEASGRLISIREQLRDSFRVVAPCTHGKACGLLTPENERHWCHHFAEPPPEIFTDSDWIRFGKLAGVDLRSLPYSYLVLDRRPAPEPKPTAVRLLGRPRVYKGYCLVLGCDACGVQEARLSQRRFPEAYRAAKKDRLGTRFDWQVQDGEVVTFEEWPSKPSGNQD